MAYEFYHNKNNEDEIKAFENIQELIKLITIKLPLQEVLKAAENYTRWKFRST